MSNVVESRAYAVAPMSEDEVLQVLQNSLYPGAALNSIRLVLGYCNAAGLDPMTKPVHLVPMWDAKLGGMRDVVMPGIELYRVKAERSGKHAGTSKPVYGPMVEYELGGVKVTVPEWCEITVQRINEDGTKAEYTAQEYWIENYAIKGGKEKSIAPNAMWSKRPRGQLAKCAEAQALRKAFPTMTGGAPTADEMEGKHIDQGEIDITPQAAKAKTEITDERLDKAIAAIKSGDYTVEKLKQSFALTDTQIQYVDNALNTIEASDSTGVADD